MRPDVRFGWKADNQRMAAIATAATTATATKISNSAAAFADGSR